MSLKNHIAAKCLTASRNLNKLRRLRKYLTVESCTSVVMGLVISHLDYCNAVFIGLPSSTLLPLQSIQNQAAKLILRVRKYDSARDCLKRLHWLPIEQRVKFKVLCLVYKSLNKQAPEYLQNMFVTRISPYSIRSITSNTLFVPKTLTKTFGSRAFSVIGAKLWNELPIHVQDKQSFIAFKKALKTVLFNEAF